MKAFLKWLGIGAGALALLLGATFAYAWWSSARALSRVYVVDDPPLLLPTDAAAIAHGRHLWETRGCGECHGAGGEGKLLFDAGPVGRIVPSNITPAALARAGYASADQVAAAIRHGVRANGTPLVFMPAGDFADLGDADTAALLAYMRTLPDSDNDPGATEVRPLGRLLHLAGAFPLTPAESLDHTPRTRLAPPVAATAEYGRYVAQICTGCHGADLAGGLVLEPSAPPSANLTPHATGLAGWSEADFARALREGVRPDGRRLALMPTNAFARMTDTEVAAMWAYLQGLAPVASKPRG